MVFAPPIGSLRRPCTHPWATATGDITALLVGLEGEPGSKQNVSGRTGAQVQGCGPAALPNPKVATSPRTWSQALLKFSCWVPLIPS